MQTDWEATVDDVECHGIITMKTGIHSSTESLQLMQTDWEATVDNVECHGIMLIIHENGHLFFHRKFVTDADGLGGDCR